MHFSRYREDKIYIFIFLAFHKLFEQFKQGVRIFFRNVIIILCTFAVNIALSRSSVNVLIRVWNNLLSWTNFGMLI